MSLLHVHLLLSRLAVMEMGVEVRAVVAEQLGQSYRLAHQPGNSLISGVWDS